MLNEEIHAQYQAVDDLDAVSEPQSSLEGEGEEEYEEEEVEFTKIKRENVFQEIDFTKRKAKIIATIG